MHLVWQGTSWATLGELCAELLFSVQFMLLMSLDMCTCFLQASRCATPWVAALAPAWAPS